MNLLQDYTWKIPRALKPFVKAVVSIRKYGLETDTHNMPFFADGCPGIMYIASGYDALLNGTTTLSNLFLYGQTVRPIEISTRGSFRAIVFHLHPYILKMLFSIEARELTDSCLDFGDMSSRKARQLKQWLPEIASPEGQIEAVFRFLQELAPAVHFNGETELAYATTSLMESNGEVSLQVLRSDMQVSERTFERKFQEYVGVSPRLFARICRFQSVLERLQQRDFLKYTDIAYDHGFSDQSHFIRTFKEFTGLTPTEYVSMLEQDEVFTEVTG